MVKSEKWSIRFAATATQDVQSPGSFTLSIQYGVVVCRNTGLTDEGHIEFSSYFGELDDVRPYQQAGRIHRLAYPELFDAGNIDPETGDVATLTTAQVIGNKVSQ